MEEQNSTEWQQPPLPEEIKEEENPPQMSEAATLGSIFFEPGKTFEDMRRKPRFLLAGIVIIIVVSAFQVLFLQKVGYENILKATNRSQSAGRTDDERAKR